MYRFSIVTFACFIFAMNAQAATLYVDASAPAGGDGTSWATAFNDLQAALSIAPVSGEIHVAQGMYKPTHRTSQFDPRSATFLLSTTEVKLKGGYAGRASTTPEARDFELYPTILSGDLNGDDDPTKPLTDPARHNSENAYHVLTTSSPFLDGLRIGYGNNIGPSSAPDTSFAHSAVFGFMSATDCIFFDNVADAYSVGSGNFFHSKFLNNFSRGAGGALASSTVMSCIFDGNEGTPGGAIYGFGTIEFCIFRNNKATRADFSLNPGKGGAIYLVGSSSIRNCIFEANQASSGGAIYCDGGSSAANRTLEIDNTVMYGNSGGAIISRNYGNIYLTNSICWSDSGGELSEDAGSAFTVKYSSIQGGFTGKIAGVSLQTTDPQFVNPAGPDGILGTADDDFRLQATSPCIDAGDNSVAGTVDLAGNRRFDDDPSVADTGNGTAPIIDIGPYERALRPLANADSATVIHGHTAIIPVLNNDITFNGGALSIIASTQGIHGFITTNGNQVSYTSDVGFVGTDSFTYTAVSSAGGLPDTGTITISVTNASPSAAAQTVSLHVGASAAITLSASDGDGDAITYSIVSPTTHGTLSGTPPNLTFVSDTFAGADSFTFKVNDSLVDSTVATVTIQTTNQLPQLSLTASPVNPIAGQSVAFNSDATDSDGDTLTYVWDFGDGASSTAASPTHVYTTAGVYTASVTVLDAARTTVSQSIQINVYHDFDRPTARFVTRDLTGYVGQPVGFDATFSSDPLNDLTSYVWDFGDGSPHGSGQLISRVYSAEGTYTVTLTVTNGQGLTDVITATMVVLPSEDAGRFTSSIEYKVKWNQNGKSADTLSLNAAINLGDTVVSKSTPMTLGIVGQSFEGTAAKVTLSRAKTSGPQVKWQVKGINKRGVPKGTYNVTCAVTRASLGQSFATAGVLGTQSATAQIPIRVGVGGSAFESSITSSFRFGSHGAKASGSGLGPK